MERKITVQLAERPRGKQKGEDDDLFAGEISEADAGDAGRRV